MFCDKMWVVKSAELFEPKPWFEPMEQFDPNEVFKDGQYLFYENGALLFRQASDTARITPGIWELKDKKLIIRFEKSFYEFSVTQISSGNMMWNYNNDISLYLVSDSIPAYLRVDADSIKLAYEIQKARTLSHNQRAESTRKALVKHKLDSLSNVVDTSKSFYPSQQIKSVTYINGKKEVLKEIHYFESGEINYVDDPVAGQMIWYYKNGNKKELNQYRNKIRIQWYETGQKSSEVSVAGALQWYENGQMKLRNISGEPYCEWHPNGVRRIEFIVEGDKETRTSWYDNGKKRTQELWVNDEAYAPTTWWENGQLMQTEKCSEKGCQLSCWNKDGSILWKGFVEGEGDWMTDHIFLELKDDNTVVKHHIMYKEEAEGMADIKEIIIQ